MIIHTQEEYDEVVANEPNSLKFIKNLIGAKEFLNNGKRWCFWLLNASPSELRKHKLLLDRIKRVKTFRENSKGAETRKYASTPSLFRDKHNPESFIVIPRVSSERRNYIPFGFFNGESIVSDSCLFAPNATLYDFGMLTSKMHMAWVKTVCGRLKSDFRYSIDIVYNNYPFPLKPSSKNRANVELKAQTVLDVRAQFPESSLADLYDPLTMPSKLIEAHQELNNSVDLCYRPQAFSNENARIEYLFKLYNQYSKSLLEDKK